MSEVNVVNGHESRKGRVPKTKDTMVVASGPHEATNSDKKRFGYLSTAEPTAVHDLICVGFGPASLAIAVALYDALEAGSLKNSPKVLFLERQPTFAWHAGMLLPGAKMQISFIKDLATLRDPMSNFTFINYLHRQGRLVEFTNLGTFLPSRIEYEDYLKWCASFFDHVVRYDSEALAVSPVMSDKNPAGPLELFTVTSRSVQTGEISSFRARNVLLAIGGQPSIPSCLPTNHPGVVHSSQYAHLVPLVLGDARTACRVVILGSGQSAAEIFNNIQVLYPNSRTWLVMRSEFLKPSDDSPFVNSIFNPSFVDLLHPKPSAYRCSLLADARNTNYGVVRLELIEQLYERMYEQRRGLGSDETKWPHRIMGGKRVARVDPIEDKLRVYLAKAHDSEILEGLSPGEPKDDVTELEALDVDLIISATGYVRNAHVDMLKGVWPLLPRKADSRERATETLAKQHVRDSWEVEVSRENNVESSIRVLEVARDYSVRFTPKTVATGSGIWLQGCCEGTHGLSDTLLSVLATRSGEVVNSIFGCGEHVNTPYL